LLTSASGAPKDYEELFVHYIGFVKAKVARAGIDSQDVEDVASEILLRFMERDGLSWYDPDRLFDTGTNPRVPGERFRPAKFQGLLNSFVGKYVMAYRDKQNLKRRREPIRNETPISDTAMWIEVYAETHAVTPDLDGVLDARDMVKSVYGYLGTLPVHGSRDLPRAFKMCVEQMTLDGKIDRKAMCAEFGVSESVVCSIFRDMRVALREGGYYGVLDAL
jgi:hypothetical protein